MEAGYREQRIRKARSQDGGATVQLKGDTMSEEMQIEALKEAYEELKEMYGDISFPQ